MAFRISILILFVPGLATPASLFSSDAKAFLGRTAVAMMHEMELSRTENRLRPIFAALPHNRYDRLDSAGVRYLMYRHFLHQHGWLMRGLVPDGDAWSMSFPVHLVEQPKMRLAVQSLLAGKGLSLHDVAVLAGELKKQVQNDSIDRLRRVWQAHGLESGDIVGMEVMDSLLDMHMATYLLPEVWKEMLAGTASASKIQTTRQEILETYPTWPRTQTFMREALESADEDRLDFFAAQRLVLRVVDLFGRWQDQECDELKHKLFEMEGVRPGRVDLARFYGEAVRNDQWMFLESRPYLQQLGALDNSDPAHPSVLIPNYISSASNHIGESRYFELGCVDDCQDLLGHMERRLGSPTATVAQIVSVALQLPSPSHPQRADLPEDLLQKLEDIAGAHGGGQVPLHGRLFAQWLHHMYPRDCPYPHAAGATNQLQADEYEARTGISATETNESMIRIISSLEGLTQVQTSTALPWDMHEEVLEPPLPRLVNSHTARVPLFLAGVVSGALMALSVFAGRLLLRSNSVVGGVMRGRLLDVDGARQTTQTPAVDHERGAANAC